MMFKDRYQIRTVRIMTRHYRNDGRYNDIPETKFVVHDEIENKHAGTPRDQRSWAIEDADELNVEFNIYNTLIYDYLFLLRTS